MNKPTLALVPLLLLAGAATAMAQDIPDWIPTDPTESLGDRERARFEERHRGTISRFSAMGSLGLAPPERHGLAYQLNINANLHFRNGEALFLFLSAQDRPSTVDTQTSLPHMREQVQSAGIGYQVSAMRFLGASDLGRRGALNLGLGMMAGEGTALALEIEPTYDILAGAFWSVPLGLKLSLATFKSPDARLRWAFLTVSLGIQHHFGYRQRLELK